MPRLLTPRLAILTAAHFTIDSYSSFYLPLLPLLVARLGLNYTLVGTLVAVGSMSSSFSQPAFGIVADRLRRPWFVALGPIVAAVFLSAIGAASSYAALVGLLVLGGFGVAAFHPQTASLAGRSVPERGKAMAFWVTGGTLGWALGPLFATATVGAFGLGRSWIAAIPGLVIGGLLLAWFARAAPIEHAHRERARLSELRPVARPLALLYLAVVARSAVSSGFATFLPLWVHEKGGSVAAGAAVTSVYLAAGALGSFAGGWLADRIGARRVVRLSFLLAAPFYAIFFAVGGPVGTTCLVLGYVLLQASLPVNVVMGQELSPRHASTISSLLMGAAWGVGALAIGPIGALADHAGLDTGLRALSTLIAAGFVCAMLLPDVRAHHTAEQAALARTGGAGGA